MINGFPYFDQVYFICMSDKLEREKKFRSQFKCFYPNFEPILFNAINTRHLKNHFIGCTLSHRAVVQEAKNKRYKNVLVFEEDVVFHKNFPQLFEQNVKELEKIEWNICYLGAMTWNKKFEKVSGCETIEVIHGSTCTEAIAYNESVYDYILDSLPSDMDEMGIFCKKHAAIDQWLMYQIQEKQAEEDNYKKKNAVIFSPRICSQPWRIFEVVKQPYQDDKKDFIV